MSANSVFGGMLPWLLAAAILGTGAVVSGWGSDTMRQRETAMIATEVQLRGQALADQLAAQVTSALAADPATDTVAALRESTETLAARQTDSINVRLINAGEQPEREVFRSSDASASPSPAQQDTTSRHKILGLSPAFFLEAQATDALINARTSGFPNAVMIVGTMVSALFAVLLLVTMTRNRKAEVLVDQRTEELAEMNKHLRESEMMAMQSEKMSSLGQMVAGVAHEINTPLGFVSSNMQMMSDIVSEFAQINDQQIMLLSRLREWNQLSIDERHEFYYAAMAQLEAIEQEKARGTLADVDSIISDSLVGLERLADLVSTLKDFSRVDRAMVENVDLHDCIESTLKIAHNNTKHKAEIVRDFGQLPRMTINPSQINQILLNLINNAAQAIDGFGVITLRTRADDTYVRLTVADSGKGIPSENLDKVFEPFFTTKAMGEGTGLGLSISQKIAKDHAGWLEVESTVGVGTQFTLVLPATAIEAIG